MWLCGSDETTAALGVAAGAVMHHHADHTMGRSVGGVTGVVMATACRRCGAERWRASTLAVAAAAAAAVWDCCRCLRCCSLLVIELHAALGVGVQLRRPAGKKAAASQSDDPLSQ